MKHAVLLLVLLLLAVPAIAADYTVTLTAAQETTTTRARQEANNAACALVGAGVGCSQAQANAAVASALNEIPPRVLPAVNIKGNNSAFVNSMVNAELKRMKAVHKAADSMTFDAKKATATQAQKDAACAAFTLPAGCLD